MRKSSEYISNHEICITIDETTDVEGRFIDNAIIGTSKAEQLSKMWKIIKYSTLKNNIRYLLYSD